MIRTAAGRVRPPPVDLGGQTSPGLQDHVDAAPYSTPFGGGYAGAAQQGPDLYRGPGAQLNPGWGQHRTDVFGGARDAMQWAPSAFQSPDPVHGGSWSSGVAFGNQDKLPTTGAARGVPNEGMVMPSAFAYPGSGGWVDSQGQHSGVAPRGWSR